MRQNGLLAGLVRLIVLLVMITVSCCGVESAASTTTPSVSLSPAWSRVELAPGASTTITLTVRLTAAAQLLSAEADCGCVHAILPDERRLPAGTIDLQVRVVGVLPGVKTLSVRTSTGVATATLQVVTPGLGDGAAIAADLQKQATAAGQQLVVIVHDLKGETRNCGCSGGSLGGIDHLAALRGLFPTARLVLTGTVERGESSASPVVGPALAPYGWVVAATDIVVTSEPLAALDKPGLLAVIDTGEQAVANQRVVKPVLDRGAVAVVLRVTPQGTIVSQHLLPIDQTLPAVAAVAHLAGVSPTVVQIERTANPSTACAACHVTAHATWTNSAHARAFASLLPADQVTNCATCHSTALPGTTARAPNVGCIACHAGAEAHAAAPTTRTAAAVDCRMCHDATHHPAFNRETSWEKIDHGK